MLEEPELIKSCSAGERAAQEELYTRYAARVLTCCRRYCDNEEDAEDILQDTFLIAFDRISSFSYRRNGSLQAWLCRIAVNQAVDRIRKRRRLPVPVGISEKEDVEAPQEEALERIPPEKLLGMIAALPEMRRAVFNLYCMDGYSHREIGKMLGISEKGSASMLAKARNQLRRAIKQYTKEQEEYGTLGKHHQE